MKKSSLLFAMLISIMPFNWLRTRLYRLIFKYTIVNTYIGFGTVLAVRKATIIESRIGRLNVFTGPMTITINAGSRIGNANKFRCPDWTEDTKAESLYEQALLIAHNTLITEHHFFDLAGKLELGQGSWIAGRGSQFWTHGARATDCNIAIGRDCYIGSSVIFAPGVTLGDNVLVGLGSVVTRGIACSNAFIAGNPARIIKQDYDWKSRSPIPQPDVTPNND